MAWPRFFPFASLLNFTFFLENVFEVCVLERSGYDTDAKNSALTYSFPHRT